MIEDHRKCDEPFGIIEEKVAQGEFEEMTTLFSEWKKKNLKHFSLSLEENTLFPALENAIGRRENFINGFFPARVYGAPLPSR
jgi:hypothetical protein